MAHVGCAGRSRSRLLFGFLGGGRVMKEKNGHLTRVRWVVGIVADSGLHHLGDGGDGGLQLIGRNFGGIEQNAYVQALDLARSNRCIHGACGGLIGGGGGFMGVVAVRAGGGCHVVRYAGAVGLCGCDIAGGAYLSARDGGALTVKLLGLIVFGDRCAWSGGYNMAFFLIVAQLFMY